MQIFKLWEDDFWSTGLKVILRREQSRLIFLCKFLVISSDSFQIDSRDGDRDRESVAYTEMSVCSLRREEKISKAEGI